MKTCKKLKPKCTIWKNTDGCCKQYRCGASLYFLSLLSSNFNINIDRMIGAPGYGKDIVDVINACDKRYLKEKMRMIENPQADDSTKRKDDHAMIGDKKSSWAVTCKKLLENNIKEQGFKSYNKYSKRETKQKMEKRIYHLQDSKGVQIVGTKKKVVGLETGKYNGISSMYNFRCDPDLGIGKAACRKIPCACLTFLEMLKTL